MAGVFSALATLVRLCVRSSAWSACSSLSCWANWVSRAISRTCHGGDQGRGATAGRAISTLRVAAGGIILRRRGSSSFVVARPSQHQGAAAVKVRLQKQQRRSSTTRAGRPSSSPLLTLQPVADGDQPTQEPHPPLALAARPRPPSSKAAREQEAAVEGHWQRASACAVAFEGAAGSGKLTAA